MKSRAINWVQTCHWQSESKLTVQYFFPCFLYQRSDLSLAVMQATIIICRIKKLWQYLPWTLSLSFTNVLKKKNLFLKYTQPHFIEIIKFIYFVAFSEYMNFSISSTVLKSSICLPLCLYLWKRNQWCNPYQRSYILRRPQNFVKVSPYFWLYVL